jgi:hypothetical protein
LDNELSKNAQASSPADIEDIPKETVGSIRRAAIELDKAAIMEIAKDLRKYNETVADFLRRKADLFDFESIERAFEDSQERKASRRKAS